MGTCAAAYHKTQHLVESEMAYKPIRKTIDI